MRNGRRPFLGAALVLALVLAAVSPAGAEDLIVDGVKVIMFENKTYDKGIIGDAGVGELTQFQSSVVFDKTLIVGNLGAGVYTLDGLLATNKLSVGQSETIGFLGAGDFSQGTIAFTGTHSVGWDLNVGSVGVGTFTLGGSGSLTVGQDENIGSGAAAGFFFQGLLSSGSILSFSGNHTVTRDLTLGFGVGGGTFTLCGGGSLEVGRDEIVGGLAGAGAFFQGVTSSGTILGFTGSHTVARDLIIGSTVGAGVFTLNGSGVLQVGRDEIIGGTLGAGAFITQADFSSTHTVGRDLIVGSYSVLSTFILNGTAASKLVVGQDEYIGKTGIGTFTTNANFGGAHTIDRDLILGTAILGGLGDGTFTLDGTGTLKVGIGDEGGSEIVGDNATGRFITNATFAGAHTISHDLILGKTVTFGISSGDGTFTLNGTAASKLEVGRDEIVGKAGTGTFNTAAGYSGTHTIARDLILGSDSGSVGTFNLDGVSPLPVGRDEYVGKAGTGTFNTAAAFSGNHTVTRDLILGNDATGVGTFNLNGTAASTLSVGQDEYVGKAGTGTFNTNAGYAGAHTITRDLILGNDATGVGAFTLDGTGTLSVGQDEFVGKAGSGTFTTNAAFAGTHTVTRDLILGNDATGVGAFTLDGTAASTLSVGQDEYVGRAGGGIFITNTTFAGTHTVARDLMIGNAAGGVGIFTLDGTGSLSVGRDEYVGNAGAGIFITNATFAGTHTVARDLMIGNAASSIGAFTMDGTGSLSVGQDEYVGKDGVGAFFTNATFAGSHTVTRDLMIGNAASSVGAFTLDGTGSLSVGQDEYVGKDGAGIFITNATFAGTHTVARDLMIGNTASSVGAFILDGTGTLSVGQDEYVGNAGAGAFTQNNGAHTVTRNLILGNAATGVGTYNLNGGSLTATTQYIGLSGSGTFTQTAGSNTVTTLEVAFNPGSSGTYSLIGGNLTATTVNLYTGGTFNEADVGNNLYATTFNQLGGTVGPGTLQNRGIPGGTGTYNYYSGTFTGSLHNYGTGIVNINPGAATGTTLNLGGNYTQDAGGLLNIKMFSATNYDNIVVGGTATLDGWVQPVLCPLGSSHFRPRGNDDFAIITAPVGTTITGLMEVWPTKALPDSCTLFWLPRHTLPNTFDLYVLRHYTNPGLSLNRYEATVGAMLDGLATSVPRFSDLDNVMNAIDYLPTAAAVKDAYKQISPEKSAALANLAFAGANNQMRNLAERITNQRFGTREIMGVAGDLGSLNLGFNKGSGLMLAYNSSDLAGLLTGTKKALPESRWGVFLEPNLIVGSRSTTTYQTGYGFTTAGFTVGADYRVWDNLLVGLATGYNHTDASFDGSGGTVQNNSWPITAYAAYLPETFYLFGSLGYTLNLFDLNRGIDFGGLSRNAKSSLTGNQFNAYGEAGYDFKLKPFVVTPTVSLAYTSISLPSFKEEGAGALNLKVASQSADSLQTGVGAKVSAPFIYSDTKIVPQVYATYQHEFSNNARTLDARLSQGSSTFLWATDKPTRDFAVVGGNVTAGFSKNLAAQINYNVEIGKANEINHFVNAGLRYQF
jgi:outer membrane autotransporter protein